jgi:hypothetical protein
MALVDIQDLYIVKKYGDIIGESLNEILEARHLYRGRDKRGLILCEDLSESSLIGKYPLSDVKALVQKGFVYATKNALDGAAALGFTLTI